MTSALPASVLNLVEMSPVEDLLLAILRERLPDISTQTLIKTKQTFPFILIRSTGSWGSWLGDPRFLDSSTIEVHVFCEGINADIDANLLSEAVRVVLRDSLNVVIPDKGYLISVEMQDRPKRSPDWQASVGPVQYADLPTGVERWESVYRVTIRKPANKPFAS
jgi:hypothetical protein